MNWLQFWITLGMFVGTCVVVGGLIVFLHWWAEFVQDHVHSDPLDLIVFISPSILFVGLLFAVGVGLTT